MPPRNNQRLIAWEIHTPPGMTIAPSKLARPWMDQSNDRFAYRCLPLVIANQAGWIIRNPIAFSARWNGGSRPEDVRLRFPKGRHDARICSHFGHAIVTITIPFLFRTPRGINLWVKGPANHIKDGIQPLEGIVETDWTEATFTMNWMLTRRNLSVRFAKGEPICMIVPVPRGLAESFDPVQKPLARNKKLQRAYEQWCASRSNFNAALGRLDNDAVERGWQRDYMLGHDSSGLPCAEHQTRLTLRPFRGETES